MLSRVLVLLALPLLLRAAAFAGEEPPLPIFGYAEYLIAPLRVHLLVSENEPTLHTTLTEADIERIIGKVNGVWRQAGLAFLVESIVREAPEPDEPPDAALPGVQGWLPRHILAANYGSDLFNVYYLKQFSVNGISFPKAVFVKDRASLQEVEGGIDEPLPRVTAHELGHQLTLVHRQDRLNLMASGTTGTSLNTAEVAQARARAISGGRFKTAAEWLASAALLRQGGKEDEAAALEKKLAALPLEAPELNAVREQVHPAPSH